MSKTWEDEFDEEIVREIILYGQSGRKKTSTLVNKIKSFIRSLLSRHQPEADWEKEFDDEIVREIILYGQNSRKKTSTLVNKIKSFIRTLLKPEGDGK